MSEALKWLGRHQNEDGSWGAASFSGRCERTPCRDGGYKEFDTGVTALALLSFLGAGYTHLSREEYPDPVTPGRVLRFGDIVKDSIKWLLAQQDSEGCIGKRTAKYMYNHAIAALALSESYRISGSPILQEPAQRAIDFLVVAQNPGKGWRYEAKSGETDSSVTGWAVMALKSAELSGLSFPRQSREDSLQWYAEATDPSDSDRVGYLARGGAKVFIQGRNEYFDDHPTPTAIAAMARSLFRRNRPVAPGGLTLVAKDPPQWNLGRIDYYYWYYATLALFLHDGPSGSMWKAWNEPLKSVLLRSQRGKKDGCLEGSWDAELDRWGSEGGRVYATAINALTLEICFRYMNVFGSKK